MRNTAAVLERNGIPFRVLDIDPGGNRTGHDLSLGKHFIEAGRPLPHPVNLFVMNPPGLESLFRDLPGVVETRNRMNVCIPFWELLRLPLSWKPVLDTMDLVLAPSRFVLEAMDAAGVAAPRLHYPQWMPLPEAVPDRERWGMPAGRTVFLFSFDISSGIQKKNPLGAMEAFRQAFPDGHAELWLKVNNRDLSTEAGQVVDRLKAVAARVPGVRVIDRTLAYRDVLSLYASADVFFSLHRGEGLGLGMMECMALGKPVIATGWSGNMDFMDAENSCLVPFDLVPVGEGTQYQAVSQGLEQQWAEPSVEAAARWMAKLDASPELRGKIGAEAKASICRHLDQAGQGNVFREVRSLVKSRPGGIAIA